MITTAAAPWARCLPSTTQRSMPESIESLVQTCPLYGANSSLSTESGEVHWDACRPTRLRRILSRMSDPVIRLNVALQGRYAIERELGEEMKQE